MFKFILVKWWRGEIHHATFPHCKMKVIGISSVSVFAVFFTSSFLFLFIHLIMYRIRTFTDSYAMFVFVLYHCVVSAWCSLFHMFLLGVQCSVFYVIYDIHIIGKFISSFCHQAKKYACNKMYARKFIHFVVTFGIYG